MKKNKRTTVIAIILSTFIISIGAGRFIQIKQNHEANTIIMEACVEDGGILTVSQKHLLSLTSATCD